MSSSTDTKSVELDDLKKQFAALQSDVKEMAEMVTMGVSERAADAKEQAIERVNAASETAQVKAEKLHADAERAITENPLAAIAIFAGIGFVLGLVSRR
jgi:ElaB/YqjD/DUF883 family membrane-anchored ribosome-binding protein